MEHQNVNSAVQPVTKKSSKISQFIQSIKTDKKKKIAVISILLFLLLCCCTTMVIGSVVGYREWDKRSNQDEEQSDEDNDDEDDDSDTDDSDDDDGDTDDDDDEDDGDNDDNDSDDDDADSGDGDDDQDQDDDSDDDGGVSSLTQPDFSIVSDAMDNLDSYALEFAMDLEGEEMLIEIQYQEPGNMYAKSTIGDVVGEEIVVGGTCYSRYAGLEWEETDCALGISDFQDELFDTFFGDESDITLEGTKDGDWYYTLENDAESLYADVYVDKETNRIENMDLEDLVSDSTGQITFSMFNSNEIQIEAPI